MTVTLKMNNKKHHVSVVRFVGVWLRFRNREGANAPNTIESIRQLVYVSRRCNNLLRGPESHRQFSGYEPDGLLLPYPAIFF